MELEEKKQKETAEQAMPVQRISPPKSVRSWQKT